MGLAPKQLGHLVVKVRDLERAEDFYTRVLGLTVTAKFDGNAVFMSANTELSHELLVVRMDDDAPDADERSQRLVHMAWQMASWHDLKALHRRLKDNDIAVRIGDHGLSLGVYFYDPDENELEAYYELPKAEWKTGGAHIFDSAFPHSLE